MITPESMAINLFISHALQDTQWVQRLQTLLRPLVEPQNLRVFLASEDIPVGSQWADVIQQNIEQADIAIVLISPSYLASDYAVSGELAALTDRQRRGLSALLPILIEGSFWTQIPELTNLQFVIDPSQPLEAMTRAEQDRALFQVAARVIELAGEIRQRRYPGIAGSEGSSISERQDIKSRFFISHSHQDGDFAELLKLKLKAEGFDAWVDVDRLEPGVDWQQEIDAAIKSSPAIILVLSPDSRKSEYVTYEWALAIGADVPVIPIMLRQTQIHPRLAAVQYLDFTLRGGRPWDRLIAALKSKLTEG